jgi:nicotinamidase-related amidase
MLNSMLNRATAWMVGRKLKSYRKYAHEKTALVLVDVQDAFMQEKGDLTRQLAALVSYAKKQQYRIVYAPTKRGINRRYRAPAHSDIQRQLAAFDNAELTPALLAPSSGDHVLQHRESLSAFSGTDLHTRLAAEGIKRLILVGPLVNTTLDSTIRDAAQLGYHTTVVSDCTGPVSPAITAAIGMTFPRYAHEVIDFSTLKRIGK